MGFTVGSGNVCLPLLILKKLVIVPRVDINVVQLDVTSLL